MYARVYVYVCLYSDGFVSQVYWLIIIATIRPADVIERLLHLRALNVCITAELFRRPEVG